MQRGESTRQAILNRAFELATTLGLERLTIGRLAEELEISKSGLFSHFQSKEKLQLEVIRVAREAFVAAVMLPALKTPRGEPRIRALFENWLKWGQRPGGCIFVQLAAELDDQPCQAREAVNEAQNDWFDAIATAARIAVSEGHFRKSLDVEQFAHELYSIMLGHHHLARFLRDPKALSRTRLAFETLLRNSR